MKVMIVGGGKVGVYLALLLRSAGHMVKVIEVRPEAVLQIQEELGSKEPVVLGSGTDPDLLEAAGIRQMDVVAAVTGLDEVNLVVTTLARFEFHVPRTIARVNHPKNVWMFTSDMGVDVALNQADLLSHLIAEEMSLGDMVTLLKLRKGQYSLIEEKVDPAAVAAHKTVGEQDWPRQCILVAIIRKGDLIIPRGDTVLEPMDEVLAVVHSSQIQSLADLLGPHRPLA
jgi:trk system potassium uptake protein TrkA